MGIKGLILDITVINILYVLYSFEVMGFYWPFKIGMVELDNPVPIGIDCICNRA